MKIMCRLGGHRAAPDQVYNSGYYFAGCERCGRQLIRTARGEWSDVPAGYRVVWKPGRHSHSLEPDYAGVRPVVVPQLSLPALRNPLLSWCRALIRLRPARGVVPAATRAAEVELDDCRYPRLLVAAVLVGAGLRMLLSLGARS